MNGYTLTCACSTGVFSGPTEPETKPCDRCGVVPQLAEYENVSFYNSIAAAWNRINPEQDPLITPEAAAEMNEHYNQ